MFKMMITISILGFSLTVHAESSEALRLHCAQHPKSPLCDGNSAELEQGLDKLRGFFNPSLVKKIAVKDDSVDDASMLRMYDKLERYLHESQGGDTAARLARIANIDDKEAIIRELKQDFALSHERARIAAIVVHYKGHRVDNSAKVQPAAVTIPNRASRALN